MDYAPLARIILRYIAGAVVGMESAQALAGDPDIVFYVALGLGMLVEAVYAYARRNGWRT